MAAARFLPGQVGATLRILVLWGCGVCLVPTSALAQFQYGGDLALKEIYIWRGLVLGSPVIQPDVFVAYQFRQVLWTAGAWTSVETGALSSEGAGYGRHWFGETDLWSEWSMQLGTVQVVAGGSVYLTQADRAVGAALNRVDTFELYGRIQLPRTILGPRLTLAVDPYRVKGAYLEGGLTWRIPGWNFVVVPVGSLRLSVDAGYNVGQGQDPLRPDEAYYFAAGTAWTHFDLSAGTTVKLVQIGALQSSLHIELHVVRLYDVAPEDVSDPKNRGRLEPWFGVTLTVWGPRCRPDREVCDG